MVYSYSGITLFELIDRSNIKNELQVANDLESVKMFNVSVRVIRIAARLGCFYKDEGIEDNQISTADKLIAGTASLTGSVICTTNQRDYPSPFFREIDTLRKTFEYKTKNNGIGYLTIYFLIPDNQLILKYYKNRIKSIKPKKRKKK